MLRHALIEHNGKPVQRSRAEDGQVISVLPASRLHRTVRKLGRFVGGNAMPPIPQSLAGRVLVNENFLGLYQGDARNDDILFTDQAVVFTDPDHGEICRVSYDQISRVEFPLPASDSIDLLLQLSSEATVKIRVVGRQGSARDVFEVGRFFKRVLEDAASK